MGAMQTARSAVLLLLWGGTAWAAPLPDCQFTLAPQRCVLHQQGVRTCSDLSFGARRACLREFEPRLRCHGRDGERCKTLVTAQERCDQLEGTPRRTCILAVLPPCKASNRNAECSHATLPVLAPPP